MVGYVTMWFPLWGKEVFSQGVLIVAFWNTQRKFLRIYFTPLRGCGHDKEYVATKITTPASQNWTSIRSNFYVHCHTVNAWYMPFQNAIVCTHVLKLTLIGMRAFKAFHSWPSSKTPGTISPTTENSKKVQCSYVLSLVTQKRLCCHNMHLNLRAGVYLFFQRFLGHFSFVPLQSAPQQGWSM